MATPWRYEQTKFQRNKTKWSRVPGHNHHRYIQNGGGLLYSPSVFFSILSATEQSYGFFKQTFVYKSKPCGISSSQQHWKNKGSFLVPPLLSSSSHPSLLICGEEPLVHYNFPVVIMQMTVFPLDVINAFAFLLSFSFFSFARSASRSMIWYSSER